MQADKLLTSVYCAILKVVVIICLSGYFFLSGDNMNTKISRQSNIELLRIIAIIGVIILHLNNKNLGGIAAKADRFGMCQFVLVFLGVLATSAVDVFVLITGYFQAKKKQADIYKPIRLILDILIVSILFYAGYFFAGNGTYQISEYIGSFIPTNWFIFVYGGLYIISPFINKLWNALKNKEKTILISTIFILYSVLPFITDFIDIEGISTYSLDGDQRGFNIVNFVLMYLIGCALREIEDNKDAVKKEVARILHINEKSIRSRILPVLFITDVGLILAFIYFGSYFMDHHPYMSRMFYYNNPLIIMEAVLLLMMFKRLKIRDNKVINFLARSTFTVYIIHLHAIRILKVGTVMIDDALQMLCFMISIAILIFIICFVCFLVYDQTFGRLLGLISKNWKKHRYIETD